MKKIYRGIWADKLENGQELPVGGSIFNDELTTKIYLDFDFFNKKLENYSNPEKMSIGYKESEAPLKDWLSKINSDFDPYLFFVTKNVQKKVERLLEIDKTKETRAVDRMLKIEKGKRKLTDLIGTSMCAEQSALGKYLLQNILKEGYFSSYMGGVESFDPKAYLENHSFIIIKDPKEKTYIFDIARPNHRNDLQRILNPKVPFNYNLFKNTKNLVVESEEVFRKDKDYFGVGNTLSDEAPKIISF